MSTSAAPAPGKPDPVSPDTARHIVALARACRASARAIALYPPEHPAVGASLAHVTDAATAAAAAGEFRLNVLPDMFTIDGRTLPKPDQAASELATMLHQHQIGQISILPQCSAEEWRRFLALVALPPDQTRRRGGLSRLWASEGQARIAVRQIDYETLLRGRLQGEDATWKAIVANCLEGDAHACDEWLTSLLLEALDDPEMAAQLLSALQERSASGGSRAPIVMAGLLRAMAEFVSHTQPDQLEEVLHAMADIAARLPTDALTAMATHARHDAKADTAAFLQRLGERMTDQSIADRIVEALRDGQGASKPLADFIAVFAPGSDRRSSVLTIARDALEHAAETPGATPVDLTGQIEQLLKGHDDKPFVSDAYAKELWQAAERAVDLDHDATDPAPVVAEWTASVADGRVRLLDAHLLVDMMGLKRDYVAWREVAALAVARTSVLVVVGDFEAAAFLVEALRLQQEDHPTPDIREAAHQTLDGLLNADLMRRVASHLDTSDTGLALAAKRFCQAVGPSVVPMLAETLSREDRTRSRQHLIGILTSFGAAGRDVIERLMQSPNAAVRRTAVLLLREFGGFDALPQLEAMLYDHEPHVQREATRAIAMMGVEPAYQTLTRALVKGTDAVRTALTGVLCSLPVDEAAAALAHLVTKAPMRGVMAPVHERALQRLGAAQGAVVVTALGDALRRGSLVAPLRTHTLRRQAADALARIGTTEALEQLHATAVGGTWGMRSAAKAALATTPRGDTRRRERER